MNINLFNETDPDMEFAGFWIDGHRVTVRTDDSVSTYTLPKGSRRVTTMRIGDERSQLILGGFKSVTVTVTGPSSTIRALREAVL